MHCAFSNCLVFVLILSRSASDNRQRDARSTDSSNCKFTQLGSEYRGSMAVSSGGYRCQSWQPEQPLHEVDSNIADIDFPERSRKAAKNYCRNPTRDPRGPWCYTLEPSVIDDDCDVPLCNLGGCRMSGIGAEYAGNRKASSSGRKCKPWNEHYKIENQKNPVFHGKNFPENSKSKAGRYCRNPDDTIGGPWCYVEDETYEKIEKEYCDVPFCDDRECLAYVRKGSTYSTLTALNSTSGMMKFWIKLWNPNDERDGEIRILLSLLSTPTSAHRIAENWKAGVELLISNKGTGLMYPDGDADDLENTPEILVGTKWTGLWISWAGGFVSIGMENKSRAIFMGEYGKKNTISNLYPDNLFYYGVTGTDVLWSTEFCQNHCEMHTTFGTDFLKVWPMQKLNSTYDIHFYVRTNRKAAVRMYQSPAALFPCFTILIDNVTSVIYQKSQNSIKQYVKQISSKELLDFWTWKEFTISILGPHLRLLSQRTYGGEEFLYVHNDLFNTLRWFSIGSEIGIAHWTLYCSPEESHAVEDPWPPNCLSDPTDYTYAGSQWTSINEVPCIPWISKEIPDSDKDDKNFVDGSALKALNKCRNPSHSAEGPYCYIMSAQSDSGVLKQYCPIRGCRSSECRMAGTANDYIGTLSQTRSGRTCAEWMSDYDLALQEAEKEKEKEKEKKVITTTKKTTDLPDLLTLEDRSETEKYLEKPFSTKERKEPLNIPKPVHTVDRELQKDRLYPEGSARNASNYCRNPSRNIGGTWCYTTDPLVPRDLCNIRDCEKAEECTFLVKGRGIGRRLYVLPEYRTEGLHFSLKAWEPDWPDSITFVFTADDGYNSRYILKIGALDNEKVLLYYQSEIGDIELVKKKTLPHLLYLGKWSSFVIRIPRGRVEIYYEGAPNPLFEWEHPEPSNAFLPVYYYYNSEFGNTIGVAFDCNSRCHVEKTETSRHTRILPLSVWSNQQVTVPRKLMLMIRGDGDISLPLFSLPATSEFYSLHFSEFAGLISFRESSSFRVKIFHKQEISDLILTSNSWTNITITWSEYTINVFKNETEVFRYEHYNPLLFYFFSFAVDFGWVTWSANCMPIDIDGPAIDGGWSEWGPWSCSASCDGGTGTRTRICNSPEPNVRGEPCIGPSSMTGQCNMIKCGDITEDTLLSVKRRIRRNHTALLIKELESITVPSDRDVVNLVFNESVDAEVEWSHNGIFLQENSRIKIKDYDIVIKEALLNDSGIYTMTLRRVDDSHLILKVISLAVIPRTPNVIVRETLALSVTCNAIALGYIYSDLKISWLIKDKVWKDYGITLPIAINIDYIPKVNKSHQGLWKCIVEQTDLNFKWTTNVILVKVIGPPNWRTYLMEDKLTRPIFGWMPNERFVGIAALVILLMITGCIIIGFIFLIKVQEKRKVKLSIKRSSKQDDGYRKLKNQDENEDKQ